MGICEKVYALVSVCENNVTINLYHGAAILIFSHSNQCNQTEAGRRISLVPFYTTTISTHYFCWIREHDQDGSSVIKVYTTLTHLNVVSIKRMNPK